MKSPRQLIVLILLAVLTPVLSGCSSKRSEMGVLNKWRDSAAPTFEKNRSTQSDVMSALGPPSQVIALQDQTLFYYLREQSRTKGFFLIIYNQTRQQITYDRAIFLFNKQAILTDFAYSQEAIPLKK
jgi:hypothetical protein